MANVLPDKTLVRARKTLSAYAVLMAAVVALSGCGVLMKGATRPMIRNLTVSTMKQRDIKLVREGAPAFLLMIDGMAEGSPDDAETLMAAARLYSAYVSAFVLDEDRVRARILSKKARDYAFAAMSLEHEMFARVRDKSLEEFQLFLPRLRPDDKEPLFLVIRTWAGYIEAHKDDWDALADIPKVGALAERLVELDETYYFGFGHLVLGVLDSLLPPALGGRLEEARAHFERAIEVSQGKFLPAYIMYAKQYALPAFDRPLYERLLKTALETPADGVPDLTLINTVAQKQADELLAEADEFF